jgi:hypothetical protein
MPKGELVIKVESDLTEYVYEGLEDDIRNLLEYNGIHAGIYDSVTGNITKTRKGMIGKGRDESKDQIVSGELMLGEKIWFKDDLRCRLRICGFTQEQIKDLRTAKFVDLILTDFIDEDMPGVVINIGGWKQKKKEDIEERYK